MSMRKNKNREQNQLRQFQQLIFMQRVLAQLNPKRTMNKIRNRFEKQSSIKEEGQSDSFLNFTGQSFIQEKNGKKKKKPKFEKCSRMKKNIREQQKDENGEQQEFFQRKESDFISISTLMENTGLQKSFWTDNGRMTPKGSAERIKEIQKDYETPKTPKHNNKIHKSPKVSQFSQEQIDFQTNRSHTPTERSHHRKVKDRSQRSLSPLIKKQRFQEEESQEYQERQMKVSRDDKIMRTDRKTRILIESMGNKYIEKIYEVS